MAEYALWRITSCKQIMAIVKVVKNQKVVHVHDINTFRFNQSELKIRYLVKKVQFHR